MAEIVQVRHEPWIATVVFDCRLNPADCLAKELATDLRESGSKKAVFCHNPNLTPPDVARQVTDKKILAPTVHCGVIWQAESTPQS